MKPCPLCKKRPRSFGDWFFHIGWKSFNCNYCGVLLRSTNKNRLYQAIALVASVLTYYIITYQYKVSDISSSLCSSGSMTAIVFGIIFGLFLFLGQIAVYELTSYEYDRTQQVREKYEEIQRIIKEHSDKIEGIEEREN